MNIFDEEKCKEWIASYIVPSRHGQVNHMHGEIGLRMMMQQDTGVKVTRDEFRDMMMDAGYGPANFGASEWEFRISSRMLRRRPKSKHVGWMASNKDKLTRRA